MKVLVTGGAGFIGSHAADAMLEAGHQVVIVDDLSTGSRANVNAAAAFYEMSICSKEFFDLRHGIAEIRFSGHGGVAN